MNDQTLQAKADRDNDTAAQSQPSAGPAGASAAPPGYGIDFLDRPQRPNRTGLPDRLKAGVEHLSGLSMDDVKVHYNSDKPAQLQALAYTQGAEIHVGPGQEQHLPHEAWHVVQQKEGRVGSTLQAKGVGINDDPGLEKEADVMGQKASQLGRLDPPAGVRRSQRAANQPTLQRKFTARTAPELPTPAEAIKRLTGLPLKQQLLPGTTARRLGELPRPESVTALVDGKSIRDGEREKATELSVVTTMARAEQYILQGVDLQKFYDAGHLIGDQLLAGTTDSFTYFNLAPQVSQFNTPVYAATEKNIRDTAKNHPVEVKVDLEYPPDYTVTVADLIRRPVIPDNQAYDADFRKKSVTIARRIPHKWTFHAKTFGKIDPTTPQYGNLGTQTLGQPFAVQVEDKVFSDAPPPQLVQIQWTERKLVGKQWSPGTTVSAEDIISLLVKTFPDVGEPEDIAKKLIASDKEIITKEVARLIKVAAGDVALELLDMGELIATLKDPTVLTPLSTEVVRTELNKARMPEATLEQAAAHLINAKAWAQDIKQAVKEAKEAEPWLFSLSQLQKLGEPQQKQQNEWDFSVSQAIPDYKPSNKTEEDILETRFSFNNAKDISSRVRNINQKFGSKNGYFEMTHIFGENEVPVKYGEAVQISNDPPRFVRVTSLERLTNPGFGYLGNWIVGFEDPG